MGGASARAGVTESFDAIVVGSGPGGAAVARELSRRGWKVLILERGGKAPVSGPRQRRVGQRATFVLRQNPRGHRGFLPGSEVGERTDHQTDRVTERATRTLGAARAQQDGRADPPDADDDPRPERRPGDRHGWHGQPTPGGNSGGHAAFDRSAAARWPAASEYPELLASEATMTRVGLSMSWWPVAGS